MNKEVREVVQHAVLASHDGEIRSIVVIMIVNGDPEVHMAVSSTEAHAMNTGADMYKLEMMKLLNIRAENRKPRE
jgi:hypothetical protein